MKNKRMKFYIGSKHSNRHGQEYEVIDRPSPSKLLVRFVKTGYTVEIFTTNNKTVRDRSHAGIGETMNYAIGDILENNRGERAEILDYRAVPKAGGSSRYEHLLRFLETGYEVWADCYNFKQGKTVDRLKPTVYGIGILGYPPEEAYPLNRNKEYVLWAGIMLRCSDDFSNMNLGYKNVTCSERWKRFDYFYEDVKELHNYDLWKKHSELEGKNPYEIDKDLIVLGNKVYSKETCMFVKKSVNASFTNWQSEEDRRSKRDKILKEMGISV